MNISLSTKITIQLKDIWNVFYVILFLLFSRNIIVIYHLYFYDETIDQVYTLLAIVIAMIFVVYVLLAKRQKLNLRILSLLLADASLVLISTILNEGSIVNFITLYYPMVTFFCFADFITQDEKKFKKFISAISILFIVLLSVNFILAGLDGKYYKEQLFFLGFENQMVFCYVLGLYFNWLNKVYNNANLKYIIYMFVYFLNAYSIRSATSQIVFLLAFIASAFPFAKKILKNIKTKYIVVVVFSLLLILSLYSLSFEKNNFLSELIVGIFQKSVTMSGRTEIWRQLLNQVFEKPFLGYGIQSESNIFLFQGRDLGAHNSFFWKLYYGGFLSLGAYFLIVMLLAKHIDLIEESQVAVIQKVTFLLFAIALMSEGVTITYLYIALFFGVGISKNKALSKNGGYNLK